MIGQNGEVLMYFPYSSSERSAAAHHNATFGIRYRFSSNGSFTGTHHISRFFQNGEVLCLTQRFWMESPASVFCSSQR